jgi:hypothetical protein
MLQCVLHGTEISATCQIQHNLERFPLNLPTADNRVLPLPRLPAVEHVTNTSQGNGNSVNVIVQITNIPPVPTTAKFIYTPTAVSLRIWVSR